MKMDRFNQEPSFLVQLAVALSLFNSWVLFEETVIDRLGWWQHLPCYRVGRFCEWDAAAIFIILCIWLVAFPSARTRVTLIPKRACGFLGCRRCRTA